MCSSFLYFILSFNKNRAPSFQFPVVFWGGGFVFINSLHYIWWGWSRKIPLQWNIVLLGHFLLIDFVWGFRHWNFITILSNLVSMVEVFPPLFHGMQFLLRMTNLFSFFLLLSFKIDFSLFFHNICFFVLLISIHSSLVISENSSRVNLETALNKLSFSVETCLDSTPIEEGDEGFSFYCNSVNELKFSFP